MTDKTTPGFNKDLVTAITVEENELVITEEVVNSHLKTYGVDISDVKKMQDNINKATNDLVGAAGKVGVDHMVKTKDIANVQGAFKIGKATTKVNVKREHEVRISPTDPSKGTRTVYGYVDAHTSSGVSPSARRNVRKEVSTYADTILK